MADPAQFRCLSMRVTGSTTMRAIEHPLPHARLVWLEWLCVETTGAIPETRLRTAQTTVAGIHRKAGPLVPLDRRAGIER